MKSYKVVEGLRWVGVQFDGVCLANDAKAFVLCVQGQRRSRVAWRGWMKTESLEEKQRIGISVCIHNIHSTTTGVRH